MLKKSLFIVLLLANAASGLRCNGRVTLHTDSNNPSLEWSTNTTLHKDPRFIALIALSAISGLGSIYIVIAAINKIMATSDSDNVKFSELQQVVNTIKGSALAFLGVALTVLSGATIVGAPHLISSLDKEIQNNHRC